MKKYEILEKLGDGTYGTVYKAKLKNSFHYVAIKKMKSCSPDWNENINSKEIFLLTKIDHVNIVKLYEIIQSHNNELNLVFEYIEENLYDYNCRRSKESKINSISETEIRNIIYQILQGLNKLHNMNIMHRDIKPENILVNTDIIVKIADFGLAKEYNNNCKSNISDNEILNVSNFSKQSYNDNLHSEYVATRWYRAPEVILCSKNYCSKIDIFAVGCIAAELFNNDPIFPGINEQDQFERYCDVLKNPSKNEWPEGYILAERKGLKFSKNSNIDNNNLHLLIPRAGSLALDLINKMLSINPSDRYSAKQCLMHPYFQCHNNLLSFLMPNINNSNTSSINNTNRSENNNDNNCNLKKSLNSISNNKINLNKNQYKSLNEESKNKLHYLESTINTNKLKQIIKIKRNLYTKNNTMINSIIYKTSNDNCLQTKQYLKKTLSNNTGISISTNNIDNKQKLDIKELSKDISEPNIVNFSKSKSIKNKDKNIVKYKENCINKKLINNSNLNILNNNDEASKKNIINPINKIYTNNSYNDFTHEKKKQQINNINSNTCNFNDKGKIKFIYNNNNINKKKLSNFKINISSIQDIYNNINNLKIKNNLQSGNIKLNKI